MSWPTVKLNEVAEIVTGTTPPKQNPEYYGEKIPFITPSELNDNEISKPAVYLSELGAKKSRILPPSSVLVCCIGSLGKVGYAHNELATNQQINSLIFDQSKIYPRFGYHFCKTLKSTLNHIAPSTTVAIVNKTRFSELKIPLPPLNEQKRIAAILDKADAVRCKRQQTIELSEQLLRSVFLDMFGDPDSNSKGWNIEPLSKIISSLEGGKNIKPAESSVNAKNRILKVSAVTSGVYRYSESKPLPADYVPPHSYFVKKGDLLISRANTSELIGASAYVHDTPDNIVLPDKIWKIKWKNIDDIDPLFVHFLLGQPAIRREISNRASGTSGSMKNIPKPKLLEIKVPLPPPTEQKKFGEIACAIYKMNNRFQSSKVNYENLFNSLTQEAFSGELSKKLEKELA